MRSSRLSPREWAALRARVLERDDWRCRKCGRPAWRLEVDHVRPLMDGGGNELGNLQTLCAHCHREKSRAERFTIPGRLEWRRLIQEAVR